MKNRKNDSLEEVLMEWIRKLLDEEMDNYREIGDYEYFLNSLITRMTIRIMEKLQEMTPIKNVKLIDTETFCKIFDDVSEGIKDISRREKLGKQLEALEKKRKAILEEIEGETE